MKKRITAALMSAALALGTLSGCASGFSHTAASSSYETGIEASSEWLAARLSEDTGISYTAHDGTVSGDGRYILGTAESAAAHGVDVSGLSDDGYIIKRLTADSDTLIFARTDEGLDRAVRYLANYCDKDAPLSIAHGEGTRVGQIVISGVPLDRYVIVCPADADECMRFAAEELRRHLGDACGVYPEIVDGSDSYAITLERDTSENSALGDEGFTIRSHERGITITGGRYRGCMYGVYTFLHDCIGYRFYFSSADDPRGTAKDSDHARRFVYTADTIEIGENDINITEQPSIAMRDVYSSERTYTSPALYYNGENYFTGPVKKYGAYGAVRKSCHGLERYVPREYFNEREEGYEYGQNPCMTNEEMIGILIDNVIAELDARVAAGQVPGRDFSDVDVGQMDINNFCMCRNCQKVYKEDGAVSGVTIRLANRVAEAIADKYPEIYVTLLAYTTTYMPPKVTPVNDRVMVSFCFYIDNDNSTLCSNHPISGEGCPTNRKFAEVFEKWHSLTDNLYVWYYPFTGYYFMNSSPNVFEIYDDIKYLTNNNIYGIFSLVGGDTLPDEFGLLSYHLLAEMTWDADITRERYHELLREYMYLMYGDGYEAIYEYLSILQKAGDLGGDPIEHRWCGFHSCPQFKLNLSYYKDNLALSYRLWNEARRLACTAEQEYAIDTLMMHIAYYDAVVNHTDMWQNGDEASRTAYREKVDFVVRELRERKIPLFIEDANNAHYDVPDTIDYDQNPLEWMPSRMGGWDYDYNY